MRSVKINDAVTIMPSSWPEVTLNQLLQIESGDSEDVIFLLSVLTNQSYKAAVDSPLLEDEVYSAVEFIYKETPKWQSLSVPKYLAIAGEAYKLPKLDKTTLGQNIMLANLLEQPLSTSIIPILAVYFQPLIDKKQFDRERLPAIEKLIGNVPATEGWAVANFFLKSMPNLKRFMNQGYVKTKAIQ